MSISKTIGLPAEGGYVSWRVSAPNYITQSGNNIEVHQSVVNYVNLVQQSYTITFVLSPSDAVLTVNGSVVTGSGDTRTVTGLHYGDVVFWEVSKNGYLSLYDEITVERDMRITVSLDEELRDQFTFSINANPYDAIVVINGIQRTSATIADGTEVEWSVSKAGYVSQSGSLTIQDDTTLNITLVALTDYPLSFEVVNGGPIYWMSDMDPRTIEYSVNNGSWTSITAAGTREASNTITLSSGDIIRFRGNNTSYGADRGGGSLNAARNYFDCTGSSISFNVFGDITSLIGGSNYHSINSYVSEYTFAGLFGGSNVVNANDLVLRVTNLSAHCYQEMFSGCRQLKTLPQLPATTLTNYCYYAMFRTCTALNSIGIILPATTLAPYCYDNMFSGCSYLYSVLPGLLPATTMTPACYSGMFSGCTRLTESPNLPATTLAESCYSSMFRYCTALTSSPVLPATTLVTRCYNTMFRDCENLSTITCLATNISATACTGMWTMNVSANGLFIKASGMEGWTTGEDGIPDGWDVQTVS